LENLNQKIENNELVVDKLIKDLKQIRNEKKILTKIITQLEEKYETERILFEYQKQREILKDGDQCPLCGAKVEIKILNQLIKKTANISETNKLLKTNKTNLNKLQAQEEKLKIKIFNIFSELNLLENIAVEKNDVFIQKIKQGFKLEIEKYPEINLELKNYTAKDNRFHFLKELKEFLDFKKSLEEELKIFNLEANENGLNQLKQIKNDFHKKQQELVSLQQDLHLLKFREELKTLQEIRENLFGKEEPAKFLQKLNEKTNLVLKLKTEIETKQEQLNNLERELKRYQDGDLNKLLDEVRGLQKKQQELIKEIGGIEREIKIDKIRLAENINREKILNEKKTEFEKWSKLNELIGSAKGDKFKVIAQQLTLESLTDFANKYLQRFNNRYLLETSKEKLDILIKDIFYSGIIRPIQTLSGGETFIVSLSLALALSDLVSEKVMINSLFLDEGFGTLDENSLDIVLSALGNLQSEGKIIGVISHVKNLRERISTQIQVKKIGSGKSKIVLVNSFG
jgi:exonuclease SbcC